MTVLDNYFDDVTGRNRNGSIGIAKVFDGGNAVGLVTDINENTGRGYLEYPAGQKLRPRRRREVTVVLKEVLVLVRIYTTDRELDAVSRFVIWQNLCSPESGR